MRISDWSSDVFSSDLSSTPLVLSDTTRLSKPSRNSLDLGNDSASGCDQRFAHSASPSTTASRLRRNAAGAPRSEERRVGKECVSKLRYRWWPYSSKKKDSNILRRGK